MTLEQWLFDPTVGKVVAMIGGIIAIRMIWGIAQRVLTPKAHGTTARYQVRKGITCTSYLAGGLLLMLIFSDQLSGLTVALGVAGAGIAFALQELIVSLAGWLANAFGGYYKTGDRVQLGGIKGNVIDIGILRTTLMECGEWVKGDLYAGRIVRVANSFVFKAPVFNYSSDFPFLWDEITLPVKYGCDLERARQILRDVANEIVGANVGRAEADWQRMLQKYAVEETPVSPVVTLIATDNWVEFTTRYVVDYKKRRLTKDRFFTRILEEVDKTGGRVAIASTTIQLVDLPQLDVRLAKRNNT